MRALAILGLILPLFGCAQASYSSLSHWKGVSSTQLIKKFGQPALTIPAVNGNLLLIYNTEFLQRYASPALPAITSAVTVSRGTPLLVNIQTPQYPTAARGLVRCSYRFEINQKNIVVNAWAHGINCTN